MRSRLVLASLLALFAAACGGTIDSPGEGGGSGGGAGAGGSAGSGGSGGVLPDSGTIECRVAAECGTDGDPPCEPCADGSVACAKLDCVAGRCVEVFPPCLPIDDGGVGPQCDPSTPCSAPAVCQLCPDGVSYSCAQADCIGGTCRTWFPACPSYDGGMGTVSCGGFGGKGCPGLGSCVDYPYDGCDPARGGADCPGECVCNAAASCAPDMYFDSSPSVCNCVPYVTDGGTGPYCKWDGDCASGGPCQLCGDGNNYSCPVAACVNGMCQSYYPPCPSYDGGTGPYCKSDAECLVPGICQPCPDGVDYTCQTGACVGGVCQSYFPACPSYDGGAGSCTADVQCPAIGAPCELCPDGKNTNCPQSLCLNGACTVHWTGCPATTSCAPQDAIGVGLCDMFMGWAWNGKSCVGLGGCSCVGADCGSLWQSASSCTLAHSGCP